MKKVIVSVTNDLYTDQRVRRTCSLLYELGYEVVLIGRLKKTSPSKLNRPYKTKRFKLFFEKGFLFYATYNLRLFFYLLFHRADLLLSNDLDTLLPNYLIHKLRKTPLIYDSHEYFLGVPEIQERLIVKKVWRIIERNIFPKLKHVITVNDSISRLYSDEYKNKILVVRNISDVKIAASAKSRGELNLPENKKIIVLQGAGINVDRGGEEAVMSMLPKFGLQNAVLYIIGDGDAIPSMKNYVIENGLEERVVFLPKMPYENLFNYTSNADLGLTLDKDTNINYRFSLPNKIFDYIHAQIPILASSLVEVKNIVEKYDIGCVLENHTPEHIALMIQKMICDEKAVDKWKKNLKIASQELSWNNESKELRDVFRKFL